MLNYITRGDAAAPPVVLIHGLFGNLDNLNNLGKALADHYYVVQLDLPNHGLSPQTEQLDYPFLANTVLTTCQALSLDKPVIIGHSIGGKIAMACALQADDALSGIVVGDIAPVAYEHHHQDVFAGLDKLWAHPPASRREADQQLASCVAEPAVRQFLLKNLTFKDGNVSWRLNYPVIKARYSDLTAWPFSSEQTSPLPALFLKGERSDYILPAYQTAISRHFPQATGKMIADTGHWLHAEKPALFNNQVKRFLARIDY